MQFLSVWPEVHSYRAQALTLVEIGMFADFQPSVCVWQYPVAIFSLIIFYGAFFLKTQFAISTICQCCLHTKQHTHLCSAAAPLQSHRERGWADAVSSISELQRTAVRVCVCVCLRICIKCDLNHISTPAVSRQHTESWNSSGSFLEISFPLVIFKLCPS